MNIRNKAIAALGAIAILGAGALANPVEAHAGKRDVAKALLGGLVVGAIVGATARNNQVVSSGPVFVQQPPRHTTFVNVRPQQCWTEENVTIDSWGNRTSSIRQVCN